jgi:RNA-binding protein Musashi
VSQECTEQYFKEFFMKFGRVIDATLMMDKDTGRPRGFGFVTFDGEDAVDRTLMQPLNIHGKPIEVKRAEPRGNMQDEKGGAHNKPFSKRDRFGGGQQQGGSFDGGDQNQFQAGGQNAQATAGMSQAQMAQYWFKMQEYFRTMQQAMAAQSVQAQAGMGMMQGGMNPAMMQQMMMNQPRMMSPGGTPMGPNGAMNPAMMQQMQGQMMQQQQQPQAGFGGAPPTAPAGPQAAMMGRSPSGGAVRPGFNAQEQMMFEQQKYERQQQARMQQSQYAAQQGMGGPTSWEGMYDDVPAPHVMAPTGPAGGRGGNFGGRGGHQNRGGLKNQHSAIPTGPVNAPPNAPTGPKNAGNRPGGNYRGGGRGRGGRGWAPY